MSLRINNNIAAINAHRNLTGTTRALASSMEKLSSGYRINRASDDPAGLVISEQFRAQIAGLGRAIENSEGSINMIQTAEGSLNELNSLLISMRELAIHAANEGFNDTDQLAADQAEITNALSTIDRIAVNTQFGTKKLLDGSNANTATITSSNTSNLSIVESGLNTGAHSLQVTKVTDSTATLNTTSLGISLSGTAGNPDNLIDGIHNIDVVQASDVATKTTGSIAITDAWGKGFNVQAAQTTASISSTTAYAATVGNEGTATVVLSYQQNGESVIANKSFSITVASNHTATNLAALFNAQISADNDIGNLVQATSSAGGGTLAFVTSNAGTQYSLNVESFTAASASVGTIASDTNSRGSSLGTLNFTIESEATGASAMTDTVTMATGAYGTMAALNTSVNAAIATAFGGAVNAFESAVVSGSNALSFTTFDEGSDYSIQMNTEGSETYRLEGALSMTVDTTKHSGINAIVSFDNYRTDITSVKYASSSTVTMYNKIGDANTLGRGSVYLQIGTAANGINTGNLLLDVAAATYSVSLDGGTGTTATGGSDALIYNSDRSEWLRVNVDLRSNGATHTIQNTDQSLVFQIGANVGQTAKIGIRNMGASSLSRNVAGNMFASLSEIDVTSSQGAQDAQSLIDNAINEVSTLRGTLGSFQKNALESNLRNLRVAKQNLSASESQIRDTDMAFEMTIFVKNQILMQAGIAMLAQANQVPQVVLSLFG